MCLTGCFKKHNRRHMDKKTALKILNLEKDPSFEEAKKVYRNLAKKYHPDVIEKKTRTNTKIKINAEAKMKEINLAFRYLAPYLKSKKTLKKTPIKKKFKQPEKKVDNGFLSKIFGVLSSALQERKDSKAFKNKVVKEKPLRKTRHSKVRFEDVFKKLYKVKPEKKLRGKKNNLYQSYQKYMALKRKIRSGYSRSNQDMNITRVEKIAPVKPVNPVNRN